MEFDQSNFATNARRQQNGLLAVTEMRARLSADRCNQRRWDQITRQIPIIDAMDIGILGLGQPPEPRLPWPRRLFSPVRNRGRARNRFPGMNFEMDQEVQKMLPKWYHCSQDEPEFPDGPPVDEYFLKSGRTRWNYLPVKDERIQELRAIRAEKIRLARLGIERDSEQTATDLSRRYYGSYGSCLLTANQLGLVVIVYIVGAVFAGNQLSVDVLLLIAGIVVASAAGQGLAFGG
ncbi:hypothetical protein PspLS_02164 [Pyricularia sp. CBS 133598]|nr:hypothetical protein PspLS_02164 [Pyricularia sp. CBS 133598]